MNKQHLAVLEVLSLSKAANEEISELPWIAVEVGGEIAESQQWRLCRGKICFDQSSTAEHSARASAGLVLYLPPAATPHLLSETSHRLNMRLRR